MNFSTSRLPGAGLNLDWATSLSREVCTEEHSIHTIVAVLNCQNKHVKQTAVKSRIPKLQIHKAEKSIFVLNVIEVKCEKH